MLAATPAPAALTPTRAPARPELLAPAGDWECARAAVENGADAIYFGLERFNARMRAKNFTQADLPALMKFLHHRGVRGYVTFNTLVFTSELADAESYLRTIIAAGVDAAIVQDVGICRLIRALSPDFPIHTSTQLTVTSAAGVASLKIEGRLKSPEYVASITRVYRQALDQICGPAAQALSSQPSALSPASPHYELQMAFSRGQYTGWFRGINNQELAHGRFGTKRGVLLGEILRVSGETITLRPAAPLKPGDGVVFDAGNPAEREEGGRIYQVESARDRSGDTLLRFGHGDINWSRVRAGQLVWKTNDPALDRELRATFEGEKIRFTRPITLELHGHVGAPLTLIARDAHGHVAQAASALPLAAAENQPLTTERLRDQLGRLGGTPFSLGDLHNHLEGAVILPVSELNRLRRETIAALEQLAAQPPRWQLNASASVLSTLNPQLSTAPEPAAPELIIVVRSLAQLDAALTCAGIATVYCEFENPKHYRDAVQKFRLWQSAGPIENRQSRIENSSIWVAPPRITKPGEEWILKQVRSCDADGNLVRNYDHLAYFAADRKRGDFSLNVANPLTAAHYLQRHGLERVTASYDLNITQLESLLQAAPGAWFDLTIHQHMPMFHMEHCVFCAFLSTGKDYRDCGRPCDTHVVTLRDRVGAELPLKADAGCRNTVYNNRAQTGADYIARLLELGARSFRVEFVNEGADEVVRTITRYQQLIRGEISGAEVWRELKLLNQLGVTRGQMETSPQFIAKKK